jgi:GNAT superfamily N-acetyltransferase
LTYAQEYNQKLEKAWLDIKEKLRKNGLNPYGLSIEHRFSCEADSFWERDMVRYIVSFNGEITYNFKAYDPESDSNSLVVPEDSTQTAGKFRCILLCISDASNTGKNPRTLADKYDGDLIEAVEPLVDKTGWLKDKYTSVNMGTDILYIDELFIYPEFRGKGIGAAVLPLIINRLARSAGIVSMIVSPTDLTSKERIEESDERYKKVFVRMVKFLKGQGFETVGRKKNLMILRL